jgi:hypothetical protein
MEKIYNIEIKGVTPLLQNRFTGADEVSANLTKKKASTTKENNVEDTLYKTADGKIYQPSESIKQALIESGKAFKKGKSNLSKTFASFIMVTPEEIIHTNQKWVTDRRAVVIPSTRGRVMRNRARFNEWALKFTITILDDDEIDEKTLHDALDYAGHYLGIGDYRPQKKGMYGRFIVSSIKEAK